MICAFNLNTKIREIKRHDKKKDIISTRIHTPSLGNYRALISLSPGSRIRHATIEQRADSSVACI